MFAWFPKPTLMPCRTGWCLRQRTVHFLYAEGLFDFTSANRAHWDSTIRALDLAGHDLLKTCNQELCCPNQQEDGEWMEVECEEHAFICLVTLVCWFWHPWPQDLQLFCLSTSVLWEVSEKKKRNSKPEKALITFHYWEPLLLPLVYQLMYVIMDFYQSLAHDLCFFMTAVTNKYRMQTKQHLFT